MLDLPARTGAAAPAFRRAAKIISRLPYDTAFGAIAQDCLPNFPKIGGGIAQMRSIAQDGIPFGIQRLGNEHSHLPRLSILRCIPARVGVGCSNEYRALAGRGHAEFDP
jgi:hypothetical protein